MTKSEIVEHLKNSTVKIDNTSRTGTGFFIASKLIATCYHNIKGHGKDELSVYWQGEEYAVRSIEINEEDDLALLEVKIDKKHPILQIDENIEVGDDCQSFGYSRKNGDVITFEYEGKDGDGRLKFKEGLFQSGLSGGAILNFRTHKICGIVKSKRDNTESVALGGRAIPISKLFGFERLDIDDNGSIFSKEMFKSWVWTSSVESADRFQFSVLALLETLVAVGLSFFVWIYYEFYWHIITGLVVAPLFFLRTKQSENESIQRFRGNYGEKELRDILFLNILSVVVFLILLYFIKSDIENLNGNIYKVLLLFTSVIYYFYSIAFIVKVITTVKYLSKKSIKSIPSNWFKIIISTDIIHPQEIIPGIEKVSIEKSLFPFYSFSNMVKKNIFEEPNLLGKVFNILLITVMYFPTLIFRYSLKSTAWIYLPLIWLIEPQNKLNLNARMRHHSKNFIAYLMFFYSWFILIVLTFLPLVFPEFIEAYTQNLPSALETIFFAYSSNFNDWFGVWYITRFISAVLTIFFMIIFTQILSKREINPSYGEVLGAKILSLKWIRDWSIYITLGFTVYHILGLLPDDLFVSLWGNMKFS